MRLTHFEAFAPHCPRCRRAGEAAPLQLASVLRASRDSSEIYDALLHCPRAACRHEYPVVDGLPIIVPDLRQHLAERGVELLLRMDLDPAVESLVADALGPGSWLDVCRQVVSSYGWDGYADLDPAEARSVGPGTAVRCMERLHVLAGDLPPLERALDAGCGAGRTAFALAERHPGALVLGIDLHIGLLRLARAALAGHVRYPRRRVGLVYDARDFPVTLPAADRVDFWACDALALPFAPSSFDLALCLNVLDAVSEPLRLLRSLETALRPHGCLLLSTPFDWTERATPVEAWIGGHSQRVEDRGDPVPRLRALLDRELSLRAIAEDLDWPWHTRLHDRATVTYRAYLLALQRAPH